METTKKKNKAMYLGAAIMALVITTAIVAGASNAQGIGKGFGKAKIAPEKNTEMEAKRVEMEKIFANNDYNAWKQMMTTQQNEMVQRHQKMMETITEENFPRFAEMHQLMFSGDRDGAKIIADELGIDAGWEGKGMGQGKGQGIGRGAKCGGGESCPCKAAQQIQQ